MSDTNKLLNDLGSAFEAFKQKNDARLEAIEKGETTVYAAKTAYDNDVNKISDEMNKLEKELDEVKSQMARSAAIENAANDIDSKEEEKAFLAFVTQGEGADRSSQKAMTVGTPSAGGYAVPEGLVREFDRLLIDSSPVRQLARNVTTSTGTWERLVGQNDAACGWTTETGARSATNTPTIGDVVITAQEMYANASVSQTALDDIFFDVEGELMEDLRQSFSRLEATAFVNGTGSGQPKGFLAYDKVTTPGTPEWGKLNNIETAANDAISFDDIIELIHTLKSGYRGNGAFGMNRAILSDIRKLKGNDNYYLYQMPSASAPATIAGYPVYEFEDMPASHTNGGSPELDTDAIVFADWKKFYAVVDRVGMRMLRDPYSNKPYVDFYATKRVGGGIVDSHAGVVLTINNS